MTSLNQNELEVLRILWQGGELKPAQIQEQFSWPIENATLRSVLVNLVEKQHAARRQQGKAFYYAAQAPKTTLLRGMVQVLARVFAGGSAKQLVAQLVETGDIQAGDLKVIRTLAKAGRSKRKKADHK
jgi:BlaI family transcriptional regulator, penicillinase repressor